MIRVPNKIALRQSQFKINLVAIVPPIIEINAPIVIKPRMTVCSRRMRLIRKFIPPSKRMTATAKPTMMCIAGPKLAGRTQFKPLGPNKTPAPRRITIPGSRICREKVCASIPMTMARSIVNAGLSAIHFRCIINKINHCEKILTNFSFSNRMI